MDQHMETNKINHELLLLKTVKNLKQKCDQSEEKLKVKDEEIEQLKELNAEKDEQLNKLNKKIEQNEDEIYYLKIFAERTSQLHLTLSHNRLQTNNHYELTLFQEDYESDDEVKKWNEMVEEVNEDENECDYLDTLKESINQYKDTFYCLTYMERFGNFIHLTPSGVFKDQFVKIPCLITTKNIQIEQFTVFEKFQQHSLGKVLFQNYGEVYSYYVCDCLYVVFCNEDEIKINLLHTWDKDKMLHLPNKEVVSMNNNFFEYEYERTIVLYFGEQSF